MKVLYILNQRFPTEKAYGTQVAKMCVALVGAGARVELLVPSRRNGIVDDAFLYYNIPHGFTVIKRFAPDFYFPGRLDMFAFALKNIVSAMVLVVTALRRRADVIYSRDELPLFFMSFFRRGLVYEAHNMPLRRSFLLRRLTKSSVKVVALTNALRDDLIAFGFKADSILVAPDGVDASVVDHEQLQPRSRNEARDQLGIPLAGSLVVYTGSLYVWKGVYCLADAAASMPEISFLVVGGDTRGAEDEFKRYLSAHRIRNVHVPGYIKSEEQLRTYLAAADVLVLPNTASVDISSRYTSPLKLFQYLAARRPIVASNLISLRDILNDNNSVLVQPDNPLALTEGIRRVLGNPSFAHKIREAAFAQARRYTWEQRADIIVKFIGASV